MAKKSSKAMARAAYSKAKSADKKATAAQKASKTKKRGK